MRRFLISGVVAGCTLAGSALAADLGMPRAGVVTPVAVGPEWSTTAILTGSYLGVTKGFSDRSAVGLQVDGFHRSGWGYHVEGAGQFREEDGAYFAGGFSYAFSPSVRAKLVVGSSSRNWGILPSFAAIGSVEFKSDPSIGLVLTPSVAYRKYRNGIEEVTPKLDLSKYFAPFANGAYIVGQVGAAAISANPGSNVGYELSGGLTYVMPSSYSVGVEVFGGQMAYDVLLPAGPNASVKNRFVGVRPKVGFNLTQTIELFVRGEFVNTQYYDVRGGTLGLVARF